MHVFGNIKNRINFKEIKIKSIALILAQILIGALLVLWITFTSHKALDDTFARSANNQKISLALLNKIDGRLNQLSMQINTVNPINPHPQITAINAHLYNIEQYLNKINPQNDLQQLQASLNHSNDEVLKKVIAMQLQIQRLKQQLTSQTYLPASMLPFKVVSIDIWNGTPQATIQLGNETALMAQGDTRDGWTLIAINFNPGYVVFKNAHHQLTKVGLN